MSTSKARRDQGYPAKPTEVDTEVQANMKRVVATQRILTPRGWRQTTDTLSPRSTLYPTRSPASEGERCWFDAEYHDVGEAAGDIAAICAGAAALVALQAARAGSGLIEFLSRV